MKILVTGAAGFIGFHVAKKLVQENHTVIGLDAINDYYDPQLKYDRLTALGIPTHEAQEFHVKLTSSSYPNFNFIRMGIEDNDALKAFFKKETPIDVVCHLAAQAGVRYSIENPTLYVTSNINGYLHILEACRNFKVAHLVYASSSSVYGLHKEVPFSTAAKVDHPISLYAATKKSNELMAYTYSHLFNFKTTGLRFFTVYGPWGRPDMALFLFTKNILANKPIQLFNNGEMERDFTYVDDIVEGVVKVVTEKKPEQEAYKVYNIGNNKSIALMDMVSTLEKVLGIRAKKVMLPNQPGDVRRTWADVTDLVKDYNYAPNTNLETGITAFVDWYKSYYKVS